MRYENDSYIGNNGRGKPITKEEIAECAERFTLGDCVCIALSPCNFLVGKITAKTKYFLQVTPQAKNSYVRTFVYPDVILMGNRIKIVSELQMLELAEKVKRRDVSDCFSLFSFGQESVEAFCL